jgi:hypothetical protein
MLQLFCRLSANQTYLSAIIDIKDELNTRIHHVVSIKPISSLFTRFSLVQLVMVLTFYYNIGCPYAQRANIALKETQTEAEYARYQPKGISTSPQT